MNIKPKHKIAFIYLLLAAFFSAFIYFLFYVAEVVIQAGKG